MKTRFTIILVLITSLSFLFTSCEKEELTDEIQLSQNAVISGEFVDLRGAAAAVQVNRSISLTLNNQVRYSGSNQNQITVSVRGYGQLHGSSMAALGTMNALNIETRLVDASSDTSSGNGELQFPGMGTLNYVTSCSSYPKPGNGSPRGFDMDIEIMGGTGTFQSASGQGLYHIQQTSAGGFSESATLDIQIN